MKDTNQTKAEPKNHTVPYGADQGQKPAEHVEAVPITPAPMDTHKSVDGFVTTEVKDAPKD